MYKNVTKSFLIDLLKTYQCNSELRKLLSLDLSQDLGFVVSKCRFRVLMLDILPSKLSDDEKNNKLTRNQVAKNI